MRTIRISLTFYQIILHSSVVERWIGPRIKAKNTSKMFVLQYHWSFTLSARSITRLIFVWKQSSQHQLTILNTFRVRIFIPFVHLLTTKCFRFTRNTKLKLCARIPVKLVSLNQRTAKLQYGILRCVGGIRRQNYYFSLFTKKSSGLNLANGH